MKLAGQLVLDAPRDLGRDLGQERDGRKCVFQVQADGDDDLPESNEGRRGKWSRARALRAVVEDLVPHLGPCRRRAERRLRVGHLGGRGSGRVPQRVLDVEGFRRPDVTEALDDMEAFLERHRGGVERPHAKRRRTRPPGAVAEPRPDVDKRGSGRIEVGRLRGAAACGGLRACARDHGQHHEDRRGAQKSSQASAPP